VAVIVAVTGVVLGVVPEAKLCSTPALEILLVLLDDQLIFTVLLSAVLFVGL
jgi:hypothetical protein